MPWELTINGLLTVFVVVFVASAGWHLAAWLLARLFK